MLGVFVVAISIGLTPRWFLLVRVTAIATVGTVYKTHKYRKIESQIGSKDRLSASL